MAKYYRANNKRGYLHARIVPGDLQLELQEVVPGFIPGAKDRSIPTIVDELMRLVIWGVQYPNPGADPDREIVSAIWSGFGQVFDITRAQEGTEATDHYIGDSIALLFTAEMSREILVFEDFEESIVGSIAYTDDTDDDGEMEVLSLPPDDEVATTLIIIPPELIVYDSFTEDIDFQESAYWYLTDYIWLAQTFTPVVNCEISSVVLKLYRIGDPGSITVSIRATDLITGKPIGPDLRVKILDGDSITTDTDGEEIEFLFDSSYSLTAGTKYVIILKHPVAQIPAYINWKSKKENSGYPGDTFFSWDAGATWRDDFLYEDGNFYFKTYGYIAEDVQYVEEDFKKILVSGGVGEAPYWQFIWADEVGGTRRV